MKQILLSVASVWSKILCAETLKSREIHSTLPEIELLQPFHHPDVNRKGGLKPIGEKQHAIGDFPANPRQFHQALTRPFNGHVVKSRQIKFAACDLLCCLEQV